MLICIVKLSKKLIKSKLIKELAVIRAEFGRVLVMRLLEMLPSLVSNSSSIHTDNRKNNFILPDGGSTDDINGSVCAAETKVNINFTKANAKFSLILHYNDNEANCLSETCKNRKL